MLACYHGNSWNASEISRSLGLTNKTIRHYVDILAGAFMVRLLPPWLENTGKRLIKSPKAYIRDSGILHSLLSIRTQAEKESHPKKQVFYKFILLCLLLAGYFSYLSYQYNLVTGGIASALT